LPGGLGAVSGAFSWTHQLCGGGGADRVHGRIGDRQRVDGSGRGSRRKTTGVVRVAGDWNRGLRVVFSVVFRILPRSLYFNGGKISWRRSPVVGAEIPF